MAYKIGARIEIEGEKEFRQQIANINSEYKTLQAQTKALSAEYDKNGDKQGALRMKTEQLNREIANRRAAQSALESMVAGAKQADAQYAQELEKLRGKLADAKQAAAEMKKALGDAAENDEGYRTQTEQVEKLERQLTATARAQEQNTRAAEAWQRQAYRAQEAAAGLEKELKDIGEESGNAGGKTERFADVLKANLTGDAIKGTLKELARLVKEVGTQSVEAAAELRAGTAMFTQTFGEQTEEAQDALTRLEETTGVSATRIRTSFATIYAFAKTMGADAATSLQIAERATVAAADSAAYYDRTMEDTIETVKAYIKGNYQNDAALGIASTETTRNAKALELYEEAKLTARQTLDSSVSLWSEMATESEWSAKKVMENWRAQYKAFDQYRENLQKAKQIGLADGIVSALSDGSEQSMQILNAMVNQSQYSVAEINAAFTDLGLAKDSAAEAIVSLDDSLKEGYAALEKTAAEAGVEIVDGIAQAIRDNAYKVGDALADAATAARDTENDAQDMFDAMTDAQPAAARNVKGAQGVTNIGDIYITQQPGEDAEAFASRVIDLLTDRTARKGAGLHG